MLMAHGQCCMQWCFRRYVWFVYCFDVLSVLEMVLLLLTVVAHCLPLVTVYVGLSSPWAVGDIWASVTICWHLSLFLGICG